MRKPRPFSHSSIYINTRKAKMAEIECRARRELGMESQQATNTDDLHGIFQDVRRHRKGQGLRWNSLKLALLVFVLIVILLSLL